jgi:IclR family transcriptional regulator, KDG regulon repressor
MIQFAAYMNSKRPTNSLERALEILELVARRSGGLTNAAISSRMGIATSTASYILNRLERSGFLQRQPETGRYEIGIKLVALAHAPLRDLGLRRTAEPVLRRLSSQTDASSLVGVLERRHVMIIDKIEKPDLAVIDMDIGVCYPVHSTALGKVLLAYLPENRVRLIFDGIPLVKSSPRTKDSKSQLLEELKRVKKQGYAVADGELFMGIRAVAAPIFAANDEVRAAVSATGLTVSVEDKRTIRAVQAAAHEISKRLAAAESGRARAHPFVTK